MSMECVTYQGGEQRDFLRFVPKMLERRLRGLDEQETTDDLEIRRPEKFSSAS